MSTSVTCDHCKKPITEVVYVLAARDAERIDSSPILGGVTHLHWDCIPHFGRSTERAEPR